MGSRAVVMTSPAWALLACFLCGWALGGPRPLRSLPVMASQAKPGPGPTWAPPQGAEAALAFLYSGDAQRLLGANCSQRYEAHGAEGRPGLPAVLQRAAGTLAQAANFLNMLLQANDIRESSVEEDVEWYQALVRSVAEGDPRAYRALLTFNPPPGASHLQLALQATRMGEETILQDLSGNRVQEGSPPEDPDSPTLQKRVLTNDLRSLDSPKWPRGDGYVGDMQQVRLSPPFLECQDGRLRPGWLVTLSATFYGLKPDLSPEVRGQVQMDIDLQNVDINQCASSPGWYSNTHLCDLNSTQCVPLESQGFVLGRYLCHCRPGFFGASGSGGLEESATQTTRQFGSLKGSSGKMLRCQPCPEGCTSCMDATPCLVEEALALRAAVLACQACCMLAVFLSMLVAYRCRGSKRIRASGVVLLEAILFGSLLLYFPVFILFFKPSVFRCIALRWVRLLGFATVYGTITLKLHRVLQLFLSRTAQRGPHPSSGQLLRRLGLLLLLVLGFLMVWTAGVLELGSQHMLLVTRGHTPTGRHFYLCHHDRWDYIMVVAEMLLLCWGSFLCYATRAVPSAFHEPRYMSIALHNELLLSAAFHTARFALVPSLHPDWTLLLFFLHTHSTVTATLALIFIPKFWKPGAPPREEILDEVYEDELDLQRSGSYLDSSIASAWSERSLDPGDIRDELKKLYAQLEIRKTKEMAANNPHLPKKRGSSRLGLGRSFIRYLAEFPEALARQHSRDSGSPGHSSLPGSSRRRLLSSSLQEAEGPPALRKTRSTYDHCREQDPPLLNSLLRRNLSKKASQWEDQESVEVPPALGFRSASAHNLTVGERLPRARPTSLHKSLSVVAGSREKALLVASQAYLEETYRQAREKEERKKAEMVMVSPVRRPSTRRLARARGAPLSAPPSPAKSSSMGSSHTSGRLHEEAGRRLPHPPIRHQVSTPILALSGACVGEPRMLSPTTTLAPAPLPALGPLPAPALTPVPTPVLTPVPAPALTPVPAPVLTPVPAPVLTPVPTPVLTPVPVTPQSPRLLTFICPWENAELPAKKENVAQESPSGPERGSHSSAPAHTKLWRALSVAVEKKGAGESELDTEDRHVHGEADDVEEDKPKVFSKSHSLKTPVQQGSMRSLGLAIKALTRSRSTYKEKEGGEDSPASEKGRAAAAAAGVGAPPRSPRLGRPRAVSKQAALAPCDDEESLQNQQNAQTSRMLQVCHQEGSREQDDRSRRTSQGLGERRVERTSKTALATLRHVFGDKNIEEAHEAPVGCQDLGSTDHRVAEVCPWEATKSEMCQPDSSNRVNICLKERSAGGLERQASRRTLSGSQEEKGRAPEKSDPKGLAVITRKKPERLVRSQEAVCPWENADPGSPSPCSAPQDSDGGQGRCEVVGSVEVRNATKHPGEANNPEVCPPNTAKAELGPWEVSGGKEGTPAHGVKELPQERQKVPPKATFWREQNLGGNLASLCPWESTDFRGPSAVSLQASGSSGSDIAEVCPWEAEDKPASKKAEICPWELGDELTGKETLSRRVDAESLQGEGKAPRKGCSEEMGEQTVKAKPTVSQGQESQESVCPTEATIPAKSIPCPDNSSSKADSRLLSNGGSQAMQACPWEVLKPEGKQATPSTADICPWEADERARDFTSEHAPMGGQSPKDKEKMTGKAGIQDVTVWEKPEEQSQKQETVCPWDSVGPDGFPQQNTERPQAIFQRPSGVGGNAAEICPWDMEETLTAEKAKICPWEVGAGVGEERASRAEATGKSAPRKPERPALEQEVVCPWDSLGPGGSSQHSDTLETDRPRAGLQEPNHEGSRPVEVCPWEAEEVSTNEKAQICPWEVNEGTTGKALDREVGNESAGQREKTLGKRCTSSGEGRSKQEAKHYQEQEAICPWEEKDLREPPTQVPEVSDLLSSTSSQVAEGHSLRVSDEATDKGDLRQDPRAGCLPDDATQRKAPALKAEFTTEDREKTCKERQSVCPWESMSSPHLDSHPDQPRAVSQTLVSGGGRVTEVCPWDAPDNSAKAEICPWEVTGRIPEKGLPRQAEKGDSWEEKGRTSEKPGPSGMAQKTPQNEDSGKQEALGPRESQDIGSVSPQPAPSTSDESKGGPKVAGCGGDRVSEVCPWEAEETPSANKAEICPWEASLGAAAAAAEGLQEVSPGRGELMPPKAGPGGAEGHFSKATAKLDSEQVTVCPQEGTGSGELFSQTEPQDTEHPKVRPHTAGGPGSRMAELCQWEVTDPEGNKIKGTMADICPWEETRAPPEESGLLALSAAQTDVLTEPGKSLCLLAHRPLDSFLPESKSSHPKVSKPSSSFALEGVREQGPLGLELRAKLAPEPSLQETQAQKAFLPDDQEQGAPEVQGEEPSPPPAYPWDWE